MSRPPKGLKVVFNLQLDMVLALEMETARGTQSRQGFIADALRYYLAHQRPTLQAPGDTP